MEKVKGVTYFNLKSEAFNKAIADITREANLKKATEYMNSLSKTKSGKLSDVFNSLVKDDIGWIRIKGEKFYYVKCYNFLIAKEDDCDYEYGDEYWIRRENTNSLDRYKTRLLEKNEVQYLFYTHKDKCLFDLSGDTFVDSSEGFMDISSGRFVYFGYGEFYVHVYNMPDRHFFETFLAEGFIPEDIDEEASEIMKELISLYKKEYIIFSNDSLLFTDKFKKDIRENKIDKVLGLDFNESKILSLTIDMDNEAVKKGVYDELLSCDYKRAQISKYDPKLLEDVNRGHWDLWQEEKADKPVQAAKTSRNTKTKATTKTAEPSKDISSADGFTLSHEIMARNPLSDIRENGIVGIDFGTKSTVVAFQDSDDNTMLMRIGSGEYEREITKDDYENPTVVEFRHINSFIQSYNAKKGRPDTRWEDITVSYTAARQLKDEKDPDKFYTFFSDLKQWSGDKTRTARIRDLDKTDKILPTYLTLKEGDFDPIEIYAYYLGLYINNMHRGIYLNYILSFPVNYEKEVRDKIIESFRRGIMKSLPEPVLNSEEAMDNFRVELGVSEPAAYAISALKEYKIEPEASKACFYGIFDFGGGTTDFDFGLWRNPKENERRYDYVIEHFNDGGDRHLGGENLLEMLAFNVFKANRDKLLKENITFFRPYECKDFPGSEALINNHSQEARLNIKHLMEKLRGLWENNSPEDIKEIESGEVSVLLFKKDGEIAPNFKLDVNKDELMKMLEERIEKGVKNFFESIKLCFNKNKLMATSGINIFLAGNSSKSPIVKALFDKYIKEETENIQKKNNGESEEYYRLYPPLGTKEANEIINKNSGNSSETAGAEADIIRPTGKTGVAYGLIEGRPGSAILVKNERQVTEEVKFKYYLGTGKKGLFQVVVDRETEYGKWHNFIDASVADFEIYYTSIPEATTNKMPLNSVKKIRRRLDKTDDFANVYIRAVAPDAIEYAVLTDKEAQDNSYTGKTVRVELSEE